MITAVYLKNPFKPQDRIIKSFSSEEVNSLLDLAQIFDVLHPDDYIFVVNGEICEDLQKEISENDKIVIAPDIKGGGGGNKNVLGIVAGLALMAFTGGAGAGILGALGSTTGSLGLGLALYFGGSLMMGNQKLPKVDAPQISGAFEGGNTWSPDTVQLRPGAPLPVLFGTMRASGQLIARQTVGGMRGGKWTQLLNVLIAFCEGEIDSISNIKINDTDITSMSGVTSQTKTGANNQTAVSIGGLTSIIEQQSFSSALANEPAASTWVTKAMTEPGERVRLDFIAPNGVYAVNQDTGATVPATLWVVGQYREVGSGTWLNLWSEYPDGQRAIVTGPNRSPVYAWEQFAPPDTSKLYEFRFRNYTLQHYNAASWGGAFTEMPQNWIVDCIWASVTVIQDTAQQTFPGVALLALEIPATQGLSGSMPKISAQITRANVWVWNPTAGAYQQKPATNIAWMVYDLIHYARRVYNTQTSAYEMVVHGEPKENLNYTEFAAWADYLGEVSDGAARGVGNLLLDSVDQMWPTVQKLAATGRGFVIQQAGIFKPVWDEPKEITQIFTAGNIKTGSIRGGFLSLKERATAIEASFIDEENNYEKTTIRVEGDDFNPLDLENPTQIFFPGVTSSKIVYRIAKLMLRRNKYLIRTQRFSADIDSITAEVGDCIGVQSDVTKWGVGGRIQAATATQIILDQDVTLEPGQTYSLLVRYENNTLVRKTVDAVLSTVTTTTLNFTGDSWSPVPERWAVYSFGLTNLETKPFTITGIRRDGDLMAEIECVEYVGAVYSDDADFPVIDYTAAGASITSLTVKADDDTGKLGISWSIPADKDYSGSIVYINGKPQGFFTTEQNNVEIEAGPGGYTVRVVPIDGRGKEGTAVEDEVTIGNAVLSPVTGISLSSLVKQQEDGTNLVYITGSFTIPIMANSVLVEIGEGSDPEVWAPVQDNRVDAIKYGPVEPGTLYTLRFTARNRYAVSESALKDITTTGDTTAPNAPSIAVTSSLKNMKVAISLGVVPSDLAGFEIYRHTSNDSASATRVGTVSNKTGVVEFIDMAENYGDVYYYWVKAFDSWGNKSVFSDSFGPVTVSMILNTDVSPEAIKQAIGSVASWSAKNCTTASIAEASGVKDVSGNAHHGRAYGGVAVVDTELGKAFDFDGTDDFAFAGDTFVNYPFTLSAWVSPDDIGHNGVILSVSDPTTNTKNYSISVNSDKISINARNGVTLYSKSSIRTIEAGKWYHVVGIFENATSRKLYVNSELEAIDDVSVDFASTATGVFLGKMHPYSSDRLNGKSFDSRIFSRALSATEIKSLYMFPGDVAFGRITSDLVTTGQLITLSAQIAEAIINDAHINNLNAAKINAGTLDAARIAADSITADKLKVGKAGAALNDDPNFEDSTAWGSRGGSANVFATTTVGKVGNNIIYADGVGMRPITAKRIPIDTAKQYRIKTWIYQNNSTSTLNYITARYADAAGNLGSQLWPKSLTKTTSGWEEISVVVTPPAGSASVIIGLDLNYNAAAGVAVYAQDFRIEEVIPETLIKDGAITTDKLTANQIVGKDFRTAANVGSGTSGVKFTSAGIEAWSGTTRTVYIQSNGSASFNGTVTAAAGNIAGFTLASNAMTAGSDSTAIGISTNTSSRAFWAGSTTATSAPFQIKHDGTGKMSNFDFNSTGLATSKTISSDVYSMTIFSNDSSIGSGIQTAVDRASGTDLFLQNSGGQIYCNWVTSGSIQHVTTVNNSSTIAVYADLKVDATSRYGFYTNGRVYAGGGYYPTSDERAKSEIVDVSVLDSLKSVRVKKYHLDSVKINKLRREKEIEQNLKEKNKAISDTPAMPECDLPEYNPCKSIGVIAQDFNKAFGIGHNDSETYNLTDAIGVALRAIQELAEIVDDLKEENKQLRAALNLPEKPKKPKAEKAPDISDLNDEEREVLHAAEEMARKNILKLIKDSEK